MPSLQLRPRLRLTQGETIILGPGKADVLESIGQTGSLAETGRSLGMSYQRVWSLVEALNAAFRVPLVLKQRGGSDGGGARLTEAGAQVLECYRAMQRDALRAAERRMAVIAPLIKG